jgi:hypothetical protein
MGTRGNTTIVDSGKTLINLYRQFDSYPMCHGKELAAFLNSVTMVNGLDFKEERKVANGAGCLAALLVSHFEGDKPGQFYLEPTDGDLDNDFAYVVKLNTMEPQAGLRVKVSEFGKRLFEGNLADFTTFCDTFED